MPLAGGTLEQAQFAKLDALIAAAGITKGDHVLEIGCGWGSMAIRAVQVHSGSRMPCCWLSKMTHLLLVFCHSRHMQCYMAVTQLLRAHGQCTSRSDIDLMRAQMTGCRLTGVTLSKQQLEEAVQRVKAAGLSESITLLFCDYREAPQLGLFDKVPGSLCRLPPKPGNKHEGAAVVLMEVHVYLAGVHVSKGWSWFVHAWLEAQLVAAVMS